MEDILNLDITQMPGLKFKCSCGHNHSVEIKKIAVGESLSSDFLDIVLPFKNGCLFIMYDSNTKIVYGDVLENLLIDNDFKTKHFFFDSQHPLIPDEKAIGRLMVEIEDNTSLIIAIGSGTLNDLGRIISHKLKIPYVIAATAPSMDGYASTVSPLIIDGFKKTFDAVYPYAIVANTEILCGAPFEMLCAGFGDIIGKYTALADWELSNRLNDEYYCQTSVDMMKNAIKKCINNADGVKKRDKNAIRYIFDALILSGIAMGLVGNSRPASGAEHHLAHYWEMDALKRNKEHPLHGNSVGVGTVVIASIYELLAPKLEFKINVPSPQEIRNLLNRAGAHENPKSLGISRELFYSSILNAKEVRPRYTILQYAHKEGLLESLAATLTNRFYGLEI